jgi:hypothetical protein
MGIQVHELQTNIILILVIEEINDFLLDPDALFCVGLNRRLG